MRKPRLEEMRQCAWLTVFSEAAQYFMKGVLLFSAHQHLLNDLCILSIYYDVMISENKLPVNVDMTVLLSLA